MKRILIVDDSKTFGSLLVRVMEKQTGCECVWAKSLGECRDALAKPGQAFDAALLDLNLPDAPDGEVVDEVLELGIPSVVFTGELSDDLRERIWSKRIVDYVRKEGVHTLGYVVRLVKRLLRNAGLKTLAVDDSRTSRSQIASFLSAHGYRVFQADCAAKALEIMESEPGIKLVVTDHNMPDRTGVELTKAIRDKAGMDEVAVIGVSAQGDRATAVALLKSGANDFISKPFLAEEFYCSVNQSVDMLNLIEDITDMANRDFLTGLNNRKYLFETGNKLFASHLRGNLSLTAAIMDIDHFKKVNDTFGHDAGDAVLRHFASLMRARFREADVLARFGGEEFCVLAVNMDPAKAFEVFDSFRKEVAANHARHAETIIPCTVSIGVSTSRTKDFDGLVKAADDLLYRSKQSGRNRVTLI
ncbi:MAG: GGDEF domain-containing response regulator [Thermodesulfobacteriota bacterium]